MKKRNKLYISILSNVILLVLTFLIIGYLENKETYSYTNTKVNEEESPYAWIQLYNDVLFKVKEQYVIDIPTKYLIQYSINGMTKVLDPHTNYFEEKEYDDMMIQTKGKFGGLGIIISIRNNVLTVISPIEGTPAYRLGIQAGDQILYINGESTKGMSLEEAVNKLRGPKGTKVKIKIKRVGVEKLLEYEITRDIITIKSVPYFTYIKEGYGYIKLVNFSSNTYSELKDAIEKLKEKNPNLKGIVLDLRNNPGGLLDQAVLVASAFLKKGSVVVSTKGRSSKEKFLNTSESPLINDSVKVVVLVNEGSASASEIVSGAIQDWDRGIILGRRTYGKGSVQSIIPLMKTDEGIKAIKLTIAYYYTPSGRCINRIENSAGYELFKKGDSTILKNDIFDTSKVYYTKKLQRVVKGGGGIKPDVEFDNEKFDLFKITLSAQSMFFNYAMKFKKEHKQKKLTKQEIINKSYYDDFLKFLKDKKFKFESEEELEYKRLLQQRVYEFSRDTLKIDSLSVEELLTYIEKHNNNDYKIYRTFYDMIENHKKDIYESHRDYIENSVKAELLSTYFGMDARYEYLTLKDKEVQEALGIITSNKYQDILSKGSHKQKQTDKK